MHKTLFVLTLGFEEKYAVRMITRHGLDKGDKLLIVTGPRVEKAEKAISYLKEFVSRYYPQEVGVEIVEVNVKDWLEATRLVKVAILDQAKEFDRVVVNMSGGMRALVLATFCATMLAEKELRDKELRVELELEDGSAIVEVPHEFFKAMKIIAQLSPEKFKILQRLTISETTVNELARELGRDVSTVRRHILDLEKAGLIKISKGRPYKVKATKEAELLL